jgi:hypothetical protein
MSVGRRQNQDVRRLETHHHGLDYANETSKDKHMNSESTDQRLRTADQRVAEASVEAFLLALDALHDTAIQKALFRRLEKEMEATTE